MKVNTVFQEKCKCKKLMCFTCISGSIPELYAKTRFVAAPIELKSFLLLESEPEIS